MKYVFIYRGNGVRVCRSVFVYIAGTEYNKVSYFFSFFQQMNAKTPIFCLVLKLILLLDCTDGPVNR